jgi:ADP-ribose pyrophosphatase
MTDIQEHWRGRFIRLLQDGRWEYVSRINSTGITGIIAVTDDDCILLNEQYRPPVQRHVIELPAGLAGDIPGEEHESLEVCARRELFEETGYEADRMELVFHGVPSAGIVDEYVHFFKASGLRQTGSGGGDESEDILVHKVPLTDVHAWLASCQARGCWIDLKVYSGLYFAGAPLPVAD